MFLSSARFRPVLAIVAFYRPWRPGSYPTGTLQGSVLLAGSGSFWLPTGPQGLCSQDPAPFRLKAQEAQLPYSWGMKRTTPLRGKSGENPCITGREVGPEGPRGPSGRSW